MKIYDAKNLKRYDKITEKRRRFYVLKILFFVGLSVALVGFILYLLFFSGLLEIREVSVSGLDKVKGEEFHGELNNRLNSKWLGLLGYQKNLFFFDSDDFKTEILAAFPEIKGITINKEPPHVLNINIEERTTAGIWCFTMREVEGSEVEGFATNCKYFDSDGAVWGQTLKSSGFLILVIEDMREMVRQGSPQIDRELLSNVMFISKQLKENSVFISKFVIPNEFIGDFSAFTSDGYELLFNIESNIKNQLEVLEIFLAEKKDPEGQANGAGDPEFKPQYIDLRINGRVYYK